MSSSPHSLADDIRKKPANESSKEIPRKYELDGIDEDGCDDYHGVRSHGFTRNDRRDMDRMGKVQELRVSCEAVFAF
jgi:hypothetical protein